MIDYLSEDDVIQIHAEVMARLGRWPSPLLDEEGLRGALWRIRGAAHYDKADVLRQAAILGVGLAQCQPFEKGNFPTAFAAMETFLELNHHPLREGAALSLARSLRLLAEEHDLDMAVASFDPRLRTSVITPRAEP